MSRLRLISPFLLTVALGAAPGQCGALDPGQELPDSGATVCTSNLECPDGVNPGEGQSGNYCCNGTCQSTSQSCLSEPGPECQSDAQCTLGTHCCVGFCWLESQACPADAGTFSAPVTGPTADAGTFSAPVTGPACQTDQECPDGVTPGQGQTGNYCCNGTCQPTSLSCLSAPVPDAGR